MPLLPMYFLIRSLETAVRALPRTKQRWTATANRYFLIALPFSLSEERSRQPSSQSIRSRSLDTKDRLAVAVALLRLAISLPACCHQTRRPPPGRCLPVRRLFLLRSCFLFRFGRSCVSTARGY